jgi:hypothetical protein
MKVPLADQPAARSPSSGDAGRLHTEAGERLVDHHELQAYFTQEDIGLAVVELRQGCLCSQRASLQFESASSRSLSIGGSMAKRYAPG